MHDLTPLPSLLGGLVIGLASAMLVFTHGRIAGISGLYGSVLSPRSASRALGVAFVLGLLGSGMLMAWLRPASFPTGPVRSLGLTVLAGLMVGYGTRLGNGCTSGHGVCGIGRLSVRSIVATLTFMLTAGLTVLVLARAGIS